MCSQRQALSLSFQEKAAHKMTKKLVQHSLFLKSHTLAAFFSHKSEINPALIIQTALNANKRCYLPVVQTEPYPHLKFCKVEENTVYRPNRYGILEPEYNNHTEMISSEALDLVLLPLVAIDNQGHRLGMGGGFYDRTFQFKEHQKKPFLLGLAYSMQCITEVPFEPYDVSLDGVVTEKNFILF